MAAKEGRRLTDAAIARLWAREFRRRIELDDIVRRARLKRLRDGVAAASASRDRRNACGSSLSTTSGGVAVGHARSCGLWG